MPNWKNRTMMMNSGGSVSRPTMTDFFEQGYANLGSEKNPDTYYNDNRRSDRNIDDLRKLMQNQYYDKISSGSDIGSIKEQINKIEKMKRKGKNLNQNLDYGPFSGSLSADENSITARANVGKGIFELLRDRDSGDNSASYRRGNYLLSGSESGRKSLDYKNGPFYGSAFTGDKRLGDGVKAGMRFSFSKGGPVQGFNTGGEVTPFLDPFTGDPIDFSTKTPSQIKAIKEARARKDAYNAKVNKNKENQIIRFKQGLESLPQPYDLLEESEMQLALRDIDGPDSARKKRAKEFLESRGIQRGVQLPKNNMFDIGPIDRVAPETTLESIALPEIPTTEEMMTVREEIENNLNPPDVDISEVIEGISNIKQDPPTEVKVDPPLKPEENENKTEDENFDEYLNGIRDEAKINEDKELKELAIRSSASYSPEAQRAGQVSSMYGQIAPGQIGGMGASLARGAFAAENKQQELDKTQAAYEEALAVQSSKNQSDLRKERLKIQAELLKDATTAARDGRYNTSTTQLPLPKIGNEEINILLRTPKNVELGLPNMPVPESIAFALTTANNYLGNIEYSIQGMNKLKKFSQKSGGLKGLIGQKAEQIGNIFGVTVENPSARISQENFGDLMALGLAKFLLEEGGKTISNQEREMVKQTLGAPGLTKGAAEMATQINNIIQRLSNVKAGAENVLVSLESQYPDEVNRQLKIINSSKEDKDKLAAISVKDIG